MAIKMPPPRVVRPARRGPPMPPLPNRSAAPMSTPPGNGMPMKKGGKVGKGKAGC